MKSKRSTEGNGIYRAFVAVAIHEHKKERKGTAAYQGPYLLVIIYERITGI